MSKAIPKNHRSKSAPQQPLAPEIDALLNDTYKAQSDAYTELNKNDIPQSFYIRTLLKKQTSLSEFDNTLIQQTISNTQRLLDRATKCLDAFKAIEVVDGIVTIKCTSYQVPN